MDEHRWAANNVAARLLAGPWTREAIAEGLAAVLGPGTPRARRALTSRLASLASDTYPPTPAALAAFLESLRFFEVAAGQRVAVVLDPPRFAPVAAFAGLRIPPIATPGELAAWLGENVQQLDWLADERRVHWQAGAEPLQHYRYAFAPKRHGPPRLIEAPKPRLKAIQRRILAEILAPVPVHDCARGFVAGQSCLTNAQAHAAEAVVATFDLAQFFPTIGLPRVHGLFRRLGYPWAVARRLAGLCTTMTPAAVFERLPEETRPDRQAQTLHFVPHLPQGAPTSPALANLLAWRLDCRLQGLARAAGANYTRYADDLAFSGDAGFARGLDRFGAAVAAIAVEEGFRLNPAKSRVMPRHRRQSVTGIVVNEHCNVGRDGYDVLKALLYNCVRGGPRGQNRAGVADFRRHLDGRVAWVEQVNPRRGAKLRRLFARIAW